MIFYFSSCGNTRWMAETLAEALGERLLSIPELMKEGRYDFEIDEGETLGFCFPTYGWRVPSIVRKFISRLKIEPLSVSYCFMATTCGDETGLMQPELVKLLKRKSLDLDLSFSLTMPESYVLLPGFKLDTHSKAIEKVTKAKRELQDFAKIIKNREKGLNFCFKGSMPFFKTHILGGLFDTLLTTDRYFWVEKDKCNSCGLCQRNCPVEDINLLGGRPEWKHTGECLTCLACYHHCPTNAIQWGRFTKKKGQYRYKY